MKVNKPIILFGTGRSGTTILMEAIFRHKQLGYFSNYLEKSPTNLWLNLFRYLFDNKFFRFFAGKPQDGNSYWYDRIVFKPSEAYPIWNNLTNPDFNFSRNYLSDVVVSESVKLNVLDYVCKVLNFQKKNRMAIKLTGPSRLEFLSTVFPDGKYLLLERTFISTLSSFLNVSFWQGRNKKHLWWEGPYTSHELKVLNGVKDNALIYTALQLQKIIEVTNHEILNLNIDVKRVTYEDFVESPSKILEEILNWADLEQSPVCFDYLKEKNISNRNKSKEAYFTNNQLSDLEKYIKPEILGRCF